MISHSLQYFKLLLFFICFSKGFGIICLRSKTKTSSLRRKRHLPLSQRKTGFVLNTVVRIFDDIKELHCISSTGVLMRNDCLAQV